MTLRIPTRVAIALAAASLLGLSACASPPPPAHHPAWLHALTDLRDARWNLEHRPGDAYVSGQEDVAITEIDRAIAEAKDAAADDGKNLGEHPREDARINHTGRMHAALDLLRKAHADLRQEEDNPQARELRGRVEHHIDLALQATQRALQEIEARE